MASPRATELFMDATDAHAALAGQFVEAINSSDVTLDMAASVVVSRRIAIDAEGGGRRIAAFLSPTGADQFWRKCGNN